MLVIGDCLEPPKFDVIPIAVQPVIEVFGDTGVVDGFPLIGCQRCAEEDAGAVNRMPSSPPDRNNSPLHVRRRYGRVMYSDRCTILRPILSVRLYLPFEDERVMRLRMAIPVTVKSGLYTLGGSPLVPTVRTTQFRGVPPCVTIVFKITSIKYSKFD